MGLANRIALSVPLPEPPPRITRVALLMALAFFAISLPLFTQSNRFPATYHPDEPSKARQVIQRTYNFHHPMLTLTSGAVAARIMGAGQSIDAVTIGGRWASAVFTASAIAFLVLTAALLHGNLAAFAAGCLLTLNHQLFELAHYFKEDPALLFGMSFFFLAMVRYWRAPSIPWLVAMGIGAGLSISGKYLGAVVLPLAVAATFLASKPAGLSHRGLILAAWLLPALVAMALINLPALLNPEGFGTGFERELGFAVGGHKGLTRSVPHGVYGAVVRQSTNPAILVFLGIYYAGLLIRDRRPSTPEWIVALFPIAFAVLLSFSPKTHHRYFLPATALLCTISAFGILSLTKLSWRRRPLLSMRHAAFAALALLALALAVQAPKFIDYFTAFQNDARRQLAAWLLDHVPAGATIVQDKRVDLRSLNVPYTILGKDFAADEGTLDELRSRGVEYIAVAEGDYGRFMLKTHRPTAEGAAEVVRRRAFYEQLFAEGELAMEMEPGRLQYLQPHLKLYRLPPAQPPPSGR